jgi:hypothetical protein
VSETGPIVCDPAEKIVTTVGGPVRGEAQQHFLIEE